MADAAEYVDEMAKEDELTEEEATKLRAAINDMCDDEGTKPHPESDDGKSWERLCELLLPAKVGVCQKHSASHHVYSSSNAINAVRQSRRDNDMSTTNDEETSGPAIDEGMPPVGTDLLRQQIEATEHKLAALRAQLPS
eukprot:COSAG01_NODE_2091_length_8453_cov_19.448049_12_plen_139_part_00